MRCRVAETSTGKIVTDSKRRKDFETKQKKERISSYDYAAWDKFDVDKALDSASSEEEKESQETPKINVTSSKGNTPTSNQKERATKLKDEGNKCYSIGRLDDAIAKYTQGMAQDPTNAILPANRAMAYIKLEKYEAAESDCNRCLKYDATYIKAYLRRGTARLKLQKLKLAAADFRKVLEMEPWNKDAKRELEKLETGRKEKQNHCDTEAQKNQKNADQAVPPHIKESPSHQNAILEKKSMNLNASSSKEDKDIENDLSDLKSNKSEKERGKKIKITEIDSGQSPRTTIASATANCEIVTPINKLPHQRSQIPLKRIKVIDVPSEDFIPEQLPSKEVISEQLPSREVIPEQLPSKEVLKASCIKDSPVVTKTVAKATVPKQNIQSPLEKPLTSTPLPAVPRTSHQFSQDWQKLSHDQPRVVEYLKAVPLSFFRGVDLEAEILVDLMSSLQWDDFSPKESISYLSALAQSDGFSVNMMFLDDSQKKVVYQLLEKCKNEETKPADLLERIKASLV